MRCEEAVPQGTTVCAARQGPASPGACPGVALLLSIPAPCCQDLGFFPQARGVNKAWRQLLLQGTPAAGAVLAP